MENYRVANLVKESRVESRRRHDPAKKTDLAVGSEGRFEGKRIRLENELARDRDEWKKP